jgi:hypothetical protein
MDWAAIEYDTHPAPDGSPMYATEADRRREAEIAERLGGLWHCELMPMPALSFVDFLVVRDRRPIAWLEVKSRNQPGARLADLGAALDLHKFAALAGAAAVPLGEPGLWRGSRAVWDCPDGLWLADIHARTPATEAELPHPRGTVGRVALVRGLRKIGGPP